MARVLAFEIKVDNVNRVIKGQADFKKALKDTKKAIDESDFGTKKYDEATKSLATLKNQQADVRRESKKLALQQQVDADKGERSIKGMTAQLKLLELQYDELGETARKTGKGLDLSDQAAALRKELSEAKAATGRTGLAGALQDAVGSIGGIDLAGLATPLGAVAAGVQLIGESAQFVNQTVAEFTKLRGEVQNLTSASGPELDEFVSRIDGIAESFGKTTNEVLLAANAVSDQLGIPFDQALTKIEEGFIAGSDQQGQFLDSLQEYPTFFREAGLSADAFFNIANKQATEGIFSDKGLDAVKEATIRLREMPAATAAAVDAIGLSSQELQDLIGEQGIGAAVAQVSEQLATLEEDSPEVGQALADIFGGPGEDAGLNFILSLQDINDETQSLIDTSNEYQQQQERILAINTEFASLQNELTKALGGQVNTFKEFALELRNGALRVLILIINNVKTFFQTLAPIRDALINLGQALGILNDQGTATAGILDFLGKAVKAQQVVFKFFADAIAAAIDRLAAITRGVRRFLSSIGLVKDNATAAADSLEDVTDAAGEAADATDQLGENQDKTQKSTLNLTKEIDKYRDATNKAAIATDQFAKGSIAELRNEVSQLQKALETAAPDDAAGILTSLLDAENALKEAENFRRLLRERIASGGEFSVVPVIQANAEKRLQIQSETAEKEIQIAKDRRAEIALLEQQRLEETITISNQVTGAIQQASGILSQAQAARTAQEIEQLETRYNREIELAKGNTTLQEELREELSEKRKEIQKREFEEQKKFRVATALTSLFEGIVNILSAPTTNPDPFGRIFKGIQIGFLGAATAVQIAAINRQQAAKGAIIEQLASGRIFSLQGGGRFTGATHGSPQGGIPISVSGRPFLVENGERFDTDETGSVAVINKRSAASFSPLLAQMQGKAFPGKRMWLSHINNYKNWGVPFMQSGGLLPDLTGISTSLPGASLQPVIIQFDDASIRDFAIVTGQAVETGAQLGTTRGLFEANRRIEREQRLNKRVGLE